MPLMKWVFGVKMDLSLSGLSRFHSFVDLFRYEGGLIPIPGQRCSKEEKRLLH